MNQSEGLDRKAFLVSMILLVVLVLIAGGMGVYVVSDPGIGDALALTAAAMRIDVFYERDVNWPDLITSSRNAMFERLDRYSSYYDAEQFENFDEELTGGYTGIGVGIVYLDEGLMILSIREDGPAAEVGLLAGDIIIEADSVSLAGLPGDEAVLHLRGRENTSVHLGISRPSTGEIFYVDVTRRRIEFLHIPFAGYTADSVIYIRLLDFDPGATDDLENALDSLLTPDKNRARGLILDLRGNPGGMFSEAYETADLFLDDGVFMVGTDGRSHWNDRQYYATGNDITGGLPLAVIVDGGSASSAEIVAGALQSSGRAVLIGDTTFGKGLVQGFVRFPDGDGLKLTVSRYYFEGPVYLNDFDSTLNDVGHGLVPDYYFDVSRLTPFRIDLETSLLLREFANMYQDDLLETTPDDSLADSWMDRFASFADESGFSFASPMTELVDEVKLTADLEISSAATFRLINGLKEKSQQVDRQELYRDSQYIKNRLRQIAYERKYGIFRSYQEVILKSRPEIQFAARLLRGEN